MRKHRVVAIGDSLNQGFASGAIHFTEYSYSAIIAREMGLGGQELLHPQLRSGGCPLNLWVRAPKWFWVSFGTMIPAELKWNGSFQCPFIYPKSLCARWAPFYGAYPNLTILDFEAQGSYPPDNYLLKWVMCRAALWALNPGYAPCLSYPTPISAAKQLPARSRDQEPNVLLGLERDPEMVTRLRLQDADEKAFIMPAGQRHYPLWKPDRFEKASGRLADEAEAIGAEWGGGEEGAKREKK